MEDDSRSSDNAHGTNQQRLSNAFRTHAWALSACTIPGQALKDNKSREKDQFAFKANFT